MNIELVKRFRFVASDARRVWSKNPHYVFLCVVFKIPHYAMCGFRPCIAGQVFWDKNYGPSAPNGAARAAYKWYMGYFLLLLCLMRSSGHAHTTLTTALTWTPALTISHQHAPSGRRRSRRTGETFRSNS